MSTSEKCFQKIKTQAYNFLERYFIFQIEKPKSTIGFKYPTLRNDPIKSPLTWLEGKRADDGAEGMWRIYDALYDVTDFVHSHPGGPDWLELTKGTDITEAFEAHHLSTVPETLLKKYFIRKAKVPRNSPFTFKDDGFYRTLKRRIIKELENVPKAPVERSKFLADSFVLGFLTTAALAVTLQSIILGMISAVLLTMTAIASHNFLHQRDNFRMYYIDLTWMTYRNWRVSHSLSHHLYTNTVYDLEISSVEPFFQYMPIKKNFFIRYVSWIYTPIVYSLIYFGYWFKGLADVVCRKRRIRIEEGILPTLFLFLYLVSGQTFLITLKFFVWIELASSLVFGAVSFSAGHHHPDVFHDGDTARPSTERDWGIYQVDAVMDKSDISSSHVLSLVSFGHHVLHHLFPTIDHGLLEYLHPILRETCREFGANFRISNHWECTKGQFQQLAKVDPNENCPPQLKKIH